MSVSARDVTDAQLRYFNAEAAQDGVIIMGEPPGVTKEEYRQRRRLMTKLHSCTVFDARSRVDDFDLDNEGFMFLRSPEAVDFRDKKQVKALYYDRMAELVKQPY